MLRILIPLSLHFPSLLRDKSFNSQHAVLSYPLLPPISMTDQLIAKRPVVFTWAELQKYPTLEARYAETLPFNDLDRLGACYWHEDERKRHCKYCIDFFDKKAKLIKRTGKRWAVSISSELFFFGLPAAMCE